MIPSPARGGRLALAAITTLALALFLLRLSAPPNLLDQDQERPAAYVLDAVNNGHWLCQRDLGGEITSKPPLWTWLSALITLACGRISVFSLYLPGALALTGTAWLVFGAARTHFGTRAALLGALASLLTTAGLKGFGLARTDAVFAFTVTAAALLAFRGWMSGRGWLWFWLLAAAATLAKGPLGPVLAGGGLLACWWERRESKPIALRGSHWVGLALFLWLTAGWLALAYWRLGDPVVSKLLTRELKAHAMTKYEKHWPGTLFWQPPLYYLGRAAPWSLFACYGLWRIWAGRPRKVRQGKSENPTEVSAACSPAGSEGVDPGRSGPAAQSTASAIRFERFVFCWFILGLALFSLAPHQRADLLWPIMPAGALVAGRELARLTDGWQPRKFYGWLSGLVTAAVAGFALYYFGPHARASLVRQTVAVRMLAAELERSAGSEFPLTHLDDPMTLQIYLNTCRPRVSRQRAVQLLRGAEACFVAVSDLRALEAERRADDPPIFTLLPTQTNPLPGSVRVVSNRAELRVAGPVAFCFGPVVVRMRGTRLWRAAENEFSFGAGPERGEVLITNESEQPRRIRVFISGTCNERFLAAHEDWKLEVPAPGHFEGSDAGLQGRRANCFASPMAARMLEGLAVPWPAML